MSHVEEEIFKSVLEEVLEELQKANRSLKEMGGTVKDLEARVRAFEDKEIKIDPPDLEPLKNRIEQMPAAIHEEAVKTGEAIRQQVVDEGGALRKETASGLAKVAAAVEAQPKPIVRRITFFPDADRQGHYKFFIRWFFGTVIGVFLIGATYISIRVYLDRAYPSGWQPTTFKMQTTVDSAVLPLPPSRPKKIRSKRIRQ